jgi:hypothetical protein
VWMLASLALGAILLMRLLCCSLGYSDLRSATSASRAAMRLTLASRSPSRRERASLKAPTVVLSCWARAARVLATASSRAARSRAIWP